MKSSSSALKLEAPPSSAQETVTALDRVYPHPGSTVPFPSVAVRKWPKLLSQAFFGWGMLSASVQSATLVPLAFAVTPGDRTGRRVWAVTLMWARGILKSVGVKTDVTYEAPLPDGPCIFVCNHQSTIDILALFDVIPRRFVFVAKKQVFSYPFIGWHISAAGYIKVDRSNRESAIKSLDVAGERIRNGVSVTVFPEGTRSKDGSILPFKKGPFILALKAGVPIVPVAIEGALNVSPKIGMEVTPNTVRIAFGKAYETKGLTEADRDALIRSVRTSIIRMHRRLGGLGGDEKNAIAASGVEGIGRAIDEDGVTG
jgi:1-acyl-sn-glycerol-3-phosphate acyltransferase